MKRLLFIVFILSYQHLFAQQFTFQLNFEDSASNRDTLTFGYDSLATFGIDTQFNEQDMFGTPFDSVFEVRTSDGNTEGNVPPTFFIKTQIIPTPCDITYGEWIQIDLTCNNWPLTVSWDSTLFQDTCRTKTYITDWITGDVGPHKPTHNSFLADSNHITFPYNQAPYLQYSYKGDSIRVFYLTISDIWPHYIGGMGDAISKQFDIHLYPIPVANTLFIKEVNNKVIHSVKILDIMGRTMTIKSINRSNRQLDVHNLEPGIYILQVQLGAGLLFRKVIKK